MESRSLAREVALLVLGQISKQNIKDYNSISLEKMLDLGLDTLINYWREQLDECAKKEFRYGAEVEEIESEVDAE